MATLDKVYDILAEVRDYVTQLLLNAVINPDQIHIEGGLSDIDFRLGLIQAGEFRSGNGREPGGGFSGVRIGYPAFSYASQDWNIAGVDNDLIQFGIRASDGTALFGGGGGILSADGITLYAYGAGPNALQNVSKYKFIDNSNNELSYLFASVFNPTNSGLALFNDGLTYGYTTATVLVGMEQGPDMLMSGTTTSGSIVFNQNQYPMTFEVYGNEDAWPLLHLNGPGMYAWFGGGIRITTGEQSPSDSVSAPLAWLHLPPGTAGRPPVRFTSQVSPLTTPVAGTMEFIGNSLQFTQYARRRGIVMSRDVLTSTFQLVSSASESAAVITAQHGADYPEIGKSEEIVLRGVIQKDTGAPNTLTTRVKYGGTTIQTIVSSNAAIPAGTPIEIRVTLTWRSLGTTGTLQVNSVVWIDGITNLPDNTTLVTVNTTIDQNITITEQFTNSSATNNLQIHQGRVLCIEPNR
jgi:hypothetical protein